ncbi:MAG TPA: S8 family peptidase, partial [Chitinophagaceae bacterium]|nr:S8 family peptidase [Chitinophagaceae bacterium]
VENFSSLGGVANYFDVKGNRIAPIIRRKPEITAPDAANTSFFGADITNDTDTFPNFFGTSAAAPHAAGVAALMIQAQKLQTITPGQVKGVLSSHTYDMDNIYTPGFDKGFDFNTGTGLIKADEAVNEVRFPNQYVKNLKLQSLCSDNPAGTRNWKIINPNSFEVNVRWFLTGDQQNGVISVPPGEYTFSTNTFYLFNRPTQNIAVIEWQDNFGFPHFDIKSSSTATCIKDVVTAAGAGQTIEKNVAAEVIEKPNLAEVFPNPSRQNFRVYLSLAKQQNIDLELYSIDGRRLYKRTLQSNGIQDIDASGYRPGVYFLKIRQGEFQKTLKLIRQ